MKRQPARVLVLGATGHAGQAVVRRALQLGRHVTAITRRPDPEALRGLNVQIAHIDGDLRVLADLACGHDLLVDAAGSYPLQVAVPGSPGWKSHVDAALYRTTQVIEAARTHNLQLAFVSSSGTLPRPDHPAEADAAVWRRMINPYYESKVVMEQAVIAAARDGLPAVIVNPVSFVGPWQFRERWNFVEMVLTGRMPFVLDQLICVVDVRDVAQAVDLAIEQEYFGRPIPLAGHNIHGRDLVMRTLQLGGRTAPVPLAVPGALVSATAYWASMMLASMGIAPPEYLGLSAIAPELMPLQPSSEQIALGVRIRPLEDSLRDAVAVYYGYPVAVDGCRKENSGG